MADGAADVEAMPTELPSGNRNAGGHRQMPDLPHVIPKEPLPTPET